MDTHKMYHLIDQLKAEGIAVEDPRRKLRQVTVDRSELPRGLRVPMRDKTPRKPTRDEKRQMDAMGVFCFDDAKAAYRCARQESLRILPDDAVDDKGKIVIPHFATVAKDPERGDFWVYRDNFHPKEGADCAIFRNGKFERLRHRSGTAQWYHYSVTYRKSTDESDVYHDKLVWARDADEAEHRIRTTDDNGKRRKPDDLRTDIQIIEVMTPDAETFSPDPELECMVDVDYLNSILDQK
jgi:hypothetical protein